MKAILAIAAAAMLLSASAASAAEPIEGTWKRNTGALIKYAGKGGKFCGTVLNTKYKGKSIGCMSGSGTSYKGEVIVLDEGKTYSGKATVNGGTMTLSGCVLAVLCKSETLVRQ